MKNKLRGIVIFKNRYYSPIFTIMKFGTFLLLLFICFAFTEKSNSQNALVTINKQKVMLKEVLDDIENQTDYLFISNREVNVERKISVKVRNKPVKELLDRLFDNTDISYSMEGINIILSKKLQEPSITSKEIIQQQKQTVTGTVIDINGEPIIGANILEKGTTNGTVTDVNGNFALNVENNAIIHISYIGYLPQDINTINKTTLEIILLEDTQTLEELVVVGYGVQKKVNLSGAVETVSQKTLQNRPVPNIGQALQGAVSNMNVTVGSGQANASPSFNIRGYTSLNGGAPLVVIDGVVSDNNQLNRMNPTDIDNISVLKDAASSAIYGSRAAFGVILVTTKKGKGEKLSVNYNNSFVYKKNTTMPDVITDPYIIATTRNIMSAPWYNLYNEEMLAIAKGRSEDPANTPLYYVDPSSGNYTYFGETDWISEAYKKFGFSTLHNIDISGQTDLLNYYFSGGYNFQDGMVKYGTDKYNQYNMRSKINFALTKWWKLGNNTSFVTSDYKAPRYLNSNYYWNINRQNPLSVPKHADGTWTSEGASVLGRMEDGGNTKTLNSTVSTQFTTQIDFIKDVFFVNGSFAYINTKNKVNSYSLPVTYYNGEGLRSYTYDPTTSASGNDATTNHVLFDVFGTFQKTFAQKHFITTLIGFNQEEYRYDYTSYSRTNLISSSLPSVSLATGDQNVGQSISTWALRGAFSRFNYIFDSKYIFEFNGRYDGTSRFPKDDRFVFNPSASIAWVLSNEKFFDSVQNTINIFKIRASYGSLGNQDVSAYAYIPTMYSGKTTQILDGEQPVYVSAPGLVAGDLTWEKVITKNIGTDLAFLNNRLIFTGDMYIRQTKDMLTAGQVLPGVLGTGVPQENAADLETKGCEITLGWRDTGQIAGKPVNYNVSFNLADSRAFITKFENPTGSLSSHYVGKELGEIWGATTLGFFTSKEDVTNSPNQSLVTSYPGTRPLEAGDLKFEDRDGSGKIDWGKWTIDDHGDWHIIGNSRNRYTFGFTTSADWNGFDASVFIQGVGKRDYYPGAGGDLFFWGIYAQPWTNVTYGNYYDRWTEETPDGYFPRFKSYVAEKGDIESGVVQTRYLQNAAYARLKNLTIGYTLPQNITRKANINRLRIFFSGDNIFEISGLYKYYKVDPEGLGGQMYPFQRYYSFGINVTL